MPLISRSDLLIPIITKLAERLLVQAYGGGMGMWKGYNRPLTNGWTIGGGRGGTRRQKRVGGGKIEVDQRFL